MSSLVENFKKLFGGEEYDEYEDYEDEEMEYESETPPVRETQLRDVTDYSNNSTSRRRGLTNQQVVNIHANVQMQVVVVKPQEYEDAQEICDQIKSRRPVVVNLEDVEYPIAQRIMDFLSGTCYSLEGSLQRVSNNIFIIAPENVDISGDFKEELKTKGVILPWVKQN